jgi:hypothetical protein
MVNYPTLLDFLCFAGDATPFEFIGKPEMIVAAASVCGLILVKKNPYLGDVVYPYPVDAQGSQEQLMSWLNEQRAIFGSEIVVDSNEDIELYEHERYELLQINEVLKERLGL